MIPTEWSKFTTEPASSAPWLGFRVRLCDYIASSDLCTSAEKILSADAASPFPSSFFHRLHSGLLRTWNKKRKATGIVAFSDDNLLVSFYSFQHATVQESDEIKLAAIARDVEATDTTICAYQVDREIARAFSALLAERHSICFEFERGSHGKRVTELARLERLTGVLLVDHTDAAAVFFCDGEFKCGLTVISTYNKAEGTPAKKITLHANFGSFEEAIFPLGTQNHRYAEIWSQSSMTWNG